MAKKPLAALVLVFSTIALVAAPVTAQAAAGDPHYFSGGLGAVARIATEEKVPVISWGTLSLTNLTTSGKVTCRDVSGGWVENPTPGGVGGPGGVGETQSFNPYECEGETCTAAVTGGGPASYIEIEAEGAEAPFPETGNGTNLRWQSHLLTEGSLIRSETKGIKLNVICHDQTATNGKGEPIFGVNASEISKGSNMPHLIAHCCKVTAPPEVEYGAGSGTLTNGAGQKSKTEGTLKVLGYNEQEIINAQAGAKS